MNELKGFEAEWLCEKMGMDKTEYRDFQDFLIREGFLKIRYKFICPECGEVCIEYENNIKKGKCQCGTCGACYSFGDVVRIGSHLVYELLYKDLQDYDEAESEESNIVPIQIVKEKVEERKIMGNQKKKIFFGSSKEAADTMDIIAALVSSLGYDTVTWNSPNASVFIAGDITIDSLLNVADKVDGAVFIFDEDDKIWYRDGIEGTVRDNVIFEYGLFMGKLGKQKVVIANKKKPKLATDLKGITYIDANKGEAEVKLQLKEWLIHKIENN